MVPTHELKAVLKTGSAHPECERLILVFFRIHSEHGHSQHGADFSPLQLHRWGWHRQRWSRRRWSHTDSQYWVLVQDDDDEQAGTVRGARHTGGALVRNAPYHGFEIMIMSQKIREKNIQSCLVMWNITNTICPYDKEMCKKFLKGNEKRFARN